MCRIPMFSPSGWFTSSRNRSTLSRLSSGSPMPIKTILEMGSPESFWAKITWSRISDGVKSLTLPAIVDAQKAHPIRQPTCEETQTVLPWWYCMTTVSMQLPSSSCHRYFTVPSSLETCLRATEGAVI